MAVLYDHRVASFDDSIQPTGTIHWGKSGGLIPVPIPHVEMKKLHHELHLVINGPNGADVSNCVQNAAVVGLLTAVVVAYATGGAATAAAEAAFTGALEGCLGAHFSATFQDHSHWITWDTYDGFHSIAAHGLCGANAPRVNSTKESNLATDLLQMLRLHRLGGPVFSKRDAAAVELNQGPGPSVRPDQLPGR